MAKRKTTEDFIKDAQAVHGDKYAYSEVTYIDARTKVVINCRLHGKFLQTPNRHLSGQGCPVCGRIAQIIKATSNTTTFIVAAQKVHEKFYDYSRVLYRDAHDKVIIICRVHGQFTQTPNSHLRGRGCPKCGTTRGADKITKPSDIFITNARRMHENQYDYSKVIYKNTHTKVIICCKLHGQFSQTPNKHLYGQGCPICKESKGEKQIAQILHSLKFDYQREVSFPNLLGDFMPLRFDFAIFKNTEIDRLIEFDGIQHFNYLKVFHSSREAFKLQQKYDRLKDRYCKKNNIKLIRISYKCKDVEKYLKEHLN